ncbi:hypothetical protein MMC25_000653 [Agyrium rufum]|nr:hypothetical protein [Agyrium rufum]
MAAVQFPPSNHVLPGSHLLPHISFPDSVNPSEISSDPETIASKWVADFNSFLQVGETDLSGVFLKDSYWRDLLCLSWDFHTFHGAVEVAKFLKGRSQVWQIKSISLDASDDFKKPKIAPFDFPGNLKGIQSFIIVETQVGHGKGFIRLLPDKNGDWKCYTLFTTLQELRDHPEMNRSRRPLGTDYGSRAGRKSWKDIRDVEEQLEGVEPTVLIIGCGQGGLSVAARLNQLGVRSLIVDRNARVGDNWRNRFDHLPYLNFPANWPVFTPKDKLADWFESYAKILELNIWTSTTVTSSKWDIDKHAWTVNLERNIEGAKKSYTFHPHHIVLATGASGKPSIPAIPGKESFKGDQLIHSSQFPGLSPTADGQGKNIIVIGSGNSAHDIAQDYHEHNYGVTMVQRSSTHVVGDRTLVDVTMAGLYCEGGPPVEDADVLNFSFPSPVLKRFHIDATNEYTRRDADVLAALQNADFKLDSGIDGSGLWTKYMSRGGGYYIDTGASALIASGAIKLKPCSIDHINTHSVTFTDGEELPADEIVFATGYGNMRDMAGEIFGEEVRGKVGDVWGFDKEGEVRGMWRRSGHEGFWFFGGNLALCRFYSLALALQIKGIEEGLYKYTEV